MIIIFKKFIFIYISKIHLIKWLPKIKLISLDKLSVKETGEKKIIYS